MAVYYFQNELKFIKELKKAAQSFKNQTFKDMDANNSFTLNLQFRPTESPIINKDGLPLPDDIGFSNLPIQLTQQQLELQERFKAIEKQRVDKMPARRRY